MERNSEPSQTSKMEHFGKIVSGLILLSLSEQSFLLDGRNL